MAKKPKEQEHDQTSASTDVGDWLPAFECLGLRTHAPHAQGAVVVSKKDRKKKRPQPISFAPSRFSLGTSDRVKAGTMDPDFPDIPLGGWTGTIQDIDQQSRSKLYLIEWNQETLDQMHPVYRKRCQRDDLELENMWLSEVELELDTGESTKIAQPTNLISRSLSKDDQDDRVRAIFGLTSDDPLPFVNDENLRKYHRYLATHLSFPFQAEYKVATIDPCQEEAILVTVMRLLHVDHFDEEKGILCEATEEGEAVYFDLAELESTVNILNRQLIEDYAYWFHDSADSDIVTWTDGGATTSSEWITFESSAYHPKSWTLFGAILRCGIGGGVIGIPLGSLFAAMEIVQIGAIVGAVMAGFLGYWVGAKFGTFFGAVNRLKRGSLYGGILGAVGGGIFGALLGALLVGLAGMLLGGLIAAFMSKWLLRGGKRILGIAMGAAAGATLQAFYFDQEKTIAGAFYGAVIGVVAGVAIVLTIYGLRAMLVRRQDHS